MEKNIIAYHHTTKENAESILKNGFNEKCFKSFSYGYGVNCFLDDFSYPVYEDKKEMIVKVEFTNCRIFEDEQYIRKSLDKIIEAHDDEQRKVAQEEAKKIKLKGYDAYIRKCHNEKDIIIFFNFPKIISANKFI